MHIAALKAVAQAHGCVDKVELLPFRKICRVKYDGMGLAFPFGALPEPSPDDMVRLNALLES